MKKAQIMLTLISIVTLVSGTLAFKAQKRLGIWYCSGVFLAAATIRATTDPALTTTFGYCTKIWGATVTLPYNWGILE